MSDLILIGEAPGGSGDEALPALEGLVGRRLAKMMGVSDQVYERNTKRYNIFETPEQGKRWARPEAALRALRMVSNFDGDSRIVLLGARVAEAFAVSGLPLYEWKVFHRWFRGDSVSVARVPHPSGRNRNLNDAEERARMSVFLSEAVRAG